MAFFVPFIVGAATGVVGTTFIKSSSGTNSQSTVGVEENEKLRVRIKEMQTQIDSLTNSNKKYRSELDANDEKIEELEDNLRDAEREIKNLREQISHSETIISEYKINVAQLESQLNKKESKS